MKYFVLRVVIFSCHLSACFCTGCHYFESTSFETHSHFHTCKSLSQITKLLLTVIIPNFHGTLIIRNEIFRADPVIIILIIETLSENEPSDMCTQRRFRSACAFAQSDLNLH